MPENKNANDTTYSELLGLIGRLSDFDTIEAILDGLHSVTSRNHRINVMGAVRLPDQFGNFDAIIHQKTVFLHASVPNGWWAKYVQRSEKHPSPIYAVAQLCLAPFTTTEVMQKLDLKGADRWSFELSQEFGMRDSLACPIGGRWVFGYWSSDVMTNRLTPQLRALLFATATFAVNRLEELVASEPDALNEATKLTPRELAVLYALSRGQRVAEAARELEIGAETVRTHIKKAQAKLGAHTQTFAVAKAIRQRLIP